MGALLRWVSRRRPWQVLATVLTLSLITSPLAASTSHPALLVLGPALAAAILFFYPLLLIFGFPLPYSTPLRRQIALVSCVLLCLVVLTGALYATPESRMPEWSRIIIGVPLLAGVYAPFFIATSVLDDARRALGQYRIGDCIGAWLCIFTYPVFGVFFIQRKVASVLDVLDTKSPKEHRSAIAV